LAGFALMVPFGAYYRLHSKVIEEMVGSH
jgi:hypothetical protein